jgi:hypothetical protein
VIGATATLPQADFGTIVRNCRYYPQHDQYPDTRVARPSDNLEALLQFYHQGLGLTVFYSFEDHEGFDGIMLGREDAPYHFEFTHARGHVAGRAPTPDNLLVFYPPDVA